MKNRLTACFKASVQLQIAFFDPADLTEDMSEDQGQNSRQDEADHNQSEPVETCNRCLCPGRNVIDPPGKDANLSNQTAGAHTAGNSCSIHAQMEHTGR